MRKNLVFIVCVAVLLLSGCTKKKIEYIDNSTSEQLEEYDIDMSNMNLKDKLCVEEEWIEYIDKDNAINISAEVTVPDVASLKVIEVSDMLFSEEEKKTLLKGLAVDEIYEYSYAYEEMTKEQLEKQIKDYENQLEILESHFENDVGSEAYYTILEDINYLNELYVNAPDKHKIATDFSRETYLINYDSKEYIVQFPTINVTDYYTSNGDLSIHIEDYIDVYNENRTGDVYSKLILEPQEIDYLGDNICNITQEEAEENAIDFVDKLQLGKFKVVDKYPLSIKCYDENDLSEIVYDGYTFVMYREIDGVCVEGDDWGSVITHPGAEIDYTSGNLSYPGYGYDKIIICVNDDGVVRFDYSTPLRIESVLSDDVKLLSYEKIQSIIRTEIISQECYKYNTFKKLELVYYPVKDKNNKGKYTIVPIWLLKSYDYNDIKSYVAVNAIDGSVVYINEEFYE